MCHAVEQSYITHADNISINYLTVVSINDL